jgi:hypothetical protein
MLFTIILILIGTLALLNVHVESCSPTYKDSSGSYGINCIGFDNPCTSLLNNIVDFNINPNPTNGHRHLRTNGWQVNGDSNNLILILRSNQDDVSQINFDSNNVIYTNTETSGNIYYLQFNGADNPITLTPTSGPTTMWFCTKTNSDINNFGTGSFVALTTDTANKFIGIIKSCFNPVIGPLTTIFGGYEFRTLDGFFQCSSQAIGIPQSVKDSYELSMTKSKSILSFKSSFQLMDCISESSVMSDKFLTSMIFNNIKSSILIFIEILGFITFSWTDFWVSLLINSFGGEVIASGFSIGWQGQYILWPVINLFNAALQLSTSIMNRQIITAINNCGVQNNLSINDMSTFTSVDSLYRPMLMSDFTG